MDEEPQLFSQKTRMLHQEGAYQRLVLFLSIFSIFLIGFLILIGSRRNGFDIRRPQDFFMVLLEGMAVFQTAVLMAMSRLRGIWFAIEKESGQDPVTCAMNRVGFEKMLEEELRRGGRYHYPITLCYIDLDGFLAFNDQMGRERGNRLLFEFTQLIRSQSRFADCVARYQQGEFCLLLPHTDIVRAEKVITRIQKKTQDTLGFCFSAGVTSYQAGENKAQFVMRAASALTQARREGPKKIRYVVGDNPTVK